MEINSEVDTTKLIDFVGILVNVESVYNYDPPKVDIDLENAEGNVIRAVLWKDWVPIIKALTYKGNKEPHIVAFYRAKINIYEGKLSIQTLYDTTDVIINGNYPEIQNFQRSIEEKKSGKASLPYKDLGKFKEWSLTDIYLKEEMMKRVEYFTSHKAQVGIYLLKAKVINIESSGKYAWFYNTCRTHYKALQENPRCILETENVESNDKSIEDETIFYCPTCQSTIKDVRSRYKIQILVGDGIGRCSLVMFDKDVYKVVSKSCMQVKNRILKGEDVTVIPQELRMLVGNTYIFKVEVKEFNLDHANTSMTIKGFTDQEALFDTYDQLIRNIKDAEEVIWDDDILSEKQSNSLVISNEGQRQCGETTEEITKKDTPCSNTYSRKRRLFQEIEL